MTDIETRPSAWHSISESPDAELAELRRRLAAAELRIMKLVQAEDFTQFSFEDMKRRAERAEAALQKSFIDALTPKLPKKLRDEAEAIADTMVDDVAAGTLYDELDIDGHVRSYLEGVTEYEADGFTPAGVEAPF